MNMNQKAVGSLLAALVGVSLVFGGIAQGKTVKKKMETKSLIVGSGCFWCTEAIFEDLKGVVDVESGYAGGFVTPVTYEQVCSGRTGHAEVVKITYKPEEVSEADLLRMFFVSHDPTTLNQQGPDYGTQYRSAIFYANQAEKELGAKIIKEISDAKLYSGKIVTTLEPLSNYQAAEEYHQDYFEKYEKASPAKRATMNAGYCSAVVAPKVAKFRQKYAAKLKKKN
jgi:peptide-methionine (S)-S-oxide reductase